MCVLYVTVLKSCSVRDDMVTSVKVEHISTDNISEIMIAEKQISVVVSSDIRSRSFPVYANYQLMEIPQHCSFSVGNNQ